MSLATAIQQAAYPLSIFRQRSFAMLWCSMTFVGMGTQMEAVVLGWFILELTDSPFLVGLIGSARMGLNFLAIFAGAAADRLPRQKLLAAVECIMAVLGLSMLLLIVTGRLEVWHIFAITVTGGMVRLFQMPAAQSLVADTVGEDRISTGAALTNLGRNMTTVVGPLVGGVLYEAAGPDGAYMAIALLYFSGGISAFGIGVTRRNRRIEGESILRSVIDGFKHAMANQVLWALLLLAVIINFTGWPLHTTLMPIFARDVLHTGAPGLGVLISAFGIGAMLGSVGWASIRNIRWTGKLLALTVILWHLSMVAFAASTSIYWSSAILLFTGASFSSTQVLMLTLLLKNTASEFRGRVLGLRSMAIYSFAFGSTNSGAMAGFWGAPWAANINAAIGIFLVGILVVFTPKFRQA